MGLKIPRMKMRENLCGGDRPGGAKQGEGERLGGFARLTAFPGFTKPQRIKDVPMSWNPKEKPAQTNAVFIFF